MFIERCHLTGRYAKVQVETSSITQTIHPTNFTLKWAKTFSAFSPIVRYIVRYKQGNSSKFTFAKDVRAESNYSTVSVMGLAPYTTYLVRIVPVDMFGVAHNETDILISTAATSM